MWTRILQPLRSPVMAVITLTSLWVAWGLQAEEERRVLDLPQIDRDLWRTITNYDVYIGPEEPPEPPTPRPGEGVRMGEAKNYPQPPLK